MYIQIQEEDRRRSGGLSIIKLCMNRHINRCKDSTHMYIMKKKVELKEQLREMGF
jgi:hypothetical protein